MVQELEQLKATNEDLRRYADGQLNSKYVMVLIDGDGYRFRDEQMQLGVQGCNEVAGLLQDCIRVYLRNSKFSNNCKIVARVYANMYGMRGHLSRSGCPRSAASLPKFAVGFSQRSGLFDFIDVGTEKEAADHKIKGGGPCRP
jgi:hypothetical protein